MADNPAGTCWEPVTRTGVVLASADVDGKTNEIMAALHNATIGVRLAGVTNITAANRHHARGSHRPLALQGIT